MSVFGVEYLVLAQRTVGAVSSRRHGSVGICRVRHPAARSPEPRRSELTNHPGGDFVRRSRRTASGSPSPRIAIRMALARIRGPIFAPMQDTPPTAVSPCVTRRASEASARMTTSASAADQPLPNVLGTLTGSPADRDVQGLRFLGPLPSSDFPITKPRCINDLRGA